jgi:WD domain, G-beta repeat/Sel1 repeat
MRASGDIVHIFDVESGMERSSLKGHKDFITDATFSPRGDLIITAANDNSARIWHSDSGAEVALLEHAGPIKSGRFSPNGQFMLTLAGDGTMKTWRLPLNFLSDQGLVDYARATSLRRTVSDAEIAGLLLDEPEQHATVVSPGEFPSDVAEQCHLLAAHPDDPDRKAKGVTFTRIQTDLAIDSCSKALKMNQISDGQIAFQLGRAYDAAGLKERANEQYEGAAKAGYRRAVSRRAVAVLERENASSQERASAITDLKRVAGLGEPYAQYELARRLLIGRDVNKNEVEAVALLKQSAKTGESSSHARLAEIYAAGRLEQRNLRKAFRHALLAVATFESRHTIESRQFRALRFNVGQSMEPSEVVAVLREVEVEVRK